MRDAWYGLHRVVVALTKLFILCRMIQLMKQGVDELMLLAGAIEMFD
jgi:hypothetical protein